MQIYVIQLWIPKDILRDEKICHSMSDAEAQRRDFVKFLEKHKIPSARVASIKVDVPDPEKVLDKLQCVEIC